LSLSALSLWLLAVVAAVVLAAGCRCAAIYGAAVASAPDPGEASAARRTLLCSAAGVAAIAGAVAMQSGIVSAPAGAVVAGGACAWLLFGRPSTAWQSTLAGCATGIAVAVQHAQGLPWWLAVALSGVAPATAAWCSRDARFAPPRIREEAAAAVTLLAPAVAAAPVLSAGWSSAQLLNRASGGGALPVPAWTWPWLIVAAAAGVLHAWWVRR